MRRTLITLAVAFSLATALWGYSRYHDVWRYSPSRNLSAILFSASGPQANPASSPLQSFRFNRSVRARMGDRELANLRLSGTVWAEIRNEIPRSVIVKIQSLTSADGKMADLPTVRFELSKDQHGGNQIKLADDTGQTDTAQAAVRFAQDLLDQLQFFEKSDLQGRYEARILKRDARYYRKTKLKYLDAPYSAAQIPISRHALTLTADGRTEKLEGLETVVLGTDALAIRSDTSYQIWADSSVTLPEHLKLAKTWVEFKAESGSKPSRTHGNKPGSVTLENTPSLAELLAAVRTGELKSGELRLGWYRKAVRRLNAESGRLNSVRDLLPELRAENEEFKLVVGALASSGQDDASQLLLETYQNENYTAEQHALVMNSWIVTDVPLTPQTTAYLLKQAVDEKSAPGQNQSALLALGAQALKIGATGAAEHAQITALLAAKLQASQTEEETVGVLDAMGNAGAPDFLAPIRNYLSSASEHIRAHAYLALRLIPGSAVAALLDSGHADPSGEVQSSVDLSLSLRLSSL